MRFTPTGLPEIDGVIDYRSSDLLGVRTADAMYRFFVGMGIAYVGHHIFADVDRSRDPGGLGGLADRPVRRGWRSLTRPPIRKETQR